jgi:hypothetical protein
MRHLPEPSADASLKSEAFHGCIAVDPQSALVATG